MSRDPRFPWQRALGEFLVIFAGISLSLLADDWRQSRNDAERERAVLAELVSDLKTDGEDLERILGSVQAWDKAAVWVQQNAGKSGLPEDSVASAIRPLFMGQRYQPVQSAYSGLKASGEMRLIREEGLRRQIVDYYEVQQPYMVQFTVTQQLVYHELLGAASGIVLWSVDSLATSFWDSQHPASFRLLRAWPDGSRDPGFLNSVTWVGTIGATFALRISTVLERNEVLRSSILAYLP